jgi:hypothetical protein
MHRIILFLGFLSFFCAILTAGDAALDRATLRGVSGINVVIDQLDPQLEQAGLTKEVLRNRIVDKLRIANIMVDTNSNVFLGLRVDGMLPKKGPDALCFALGFYQPVILSRDAKIRTATLTWDVRTVLMVAPKPMVQSALNTIEQLTDQFVSAYRSVN